MAVTRGLIDLDKPLLEYGVAPAADWNRSGVDFYPKVTARHLLTQTSGVGEFEPGTRFTYDSDEYIQHLSPLLTIATKMHASKFATEYWAKPLGLPNYFALDDLDNGDISAGGGQLGTCRDAAKIGALLTQRGWWHGEKGTRTGSRIVGEEYMREMIQPSYSNVSSCYGFLTWLSQTHAKTTCAGPKWPGDYTDRGQYHSCDNVSIASTPLLGDGIISIDAPESVGIALGYLGKLAFMMPSLNLTILTIGSTWPATPACGYDEAFSMTQAWRAVEPVYKYYKEYPLVDVPDEAAWLSDLRSIAAGSHATVSEASGHVHTPRGKGRVSQYKPDGRKAPRVDARTAEAGSPGADAPDNVIGSCWCLCPPYQGFGGCFNVTAKDHGTPGDCASYASQNAHIVQAARQLCPAVTFAQQCWVANPPAAPYSCAGDSQIEHMTCENSTSCSDKVGPHASNFAHQTCECRASEWAELDWFDSACYDSPYYAPIEVAARTRVST